MWRKRWPCSWLVHTMDRAWPWASAISGCGHKSRKVICCTWASITASNHRRIFAECKTCTLPGCAMICYTWIRSSVSQPTGLWLESWWCQQDSSSNCCSTRSVHGTRLHSEAHLLWLWFRNAMQEWELWLHRLPNSMYNILCLWSWSLVFEQANYCQSNWWQWRRCRRCRGRQLNLHNLL